MKTYYLFIHPNLKEHKFYAHRIGMIKEVNTGTGEEVVLVEFIAPAP